MNTQHTTMRNTTIASGLLALGIALSGLVAPAATAAPGDATQAGTVDVAKCRAATAKVKKAQKKFTAAKGPGFSVADLERADQALADAKSAKTKACAKRAPAPTWDRPKTPREVKLLAAELDPETANGAVRVVLDKPTVLGECPLDPDPVVLLSVPTQENEQMWGMSVKIFKASLSDEIRVRLHIEVKDGDGLPWGYWGPASPAVIDKSYDLHTEAGVLYEMTTYAYGAKDITKSTVNVTATCEWLNP